MRSNIITNLDAKNHKVEDYHFRVLVDEQPVDNNEEPTINSQIIQEAQETLDTKQEIQEATPPQIQPSTINTANEELLKKIELLSENVVKLQMQIETNEQEFQKRLEAEIGTAKENAYNEGKNEAKALYDSELDKLNEKLLKSIEKIDKKIGEIDEFLHKNESELSSSAIDIATQIVAKEVEQNSSCIAYALSKELMQDISKDIKVKISVNPKDFTYINDKYQVENIKIIADDAVNAGCVVILSDELNVEASLADRINKVKNMVLKG